jgi:hypothetical protein
VSPTKVIVAGIGCEQVQQVNASHVHGDSTCGQA